jgi:uncharacterized protein YbcC (UPF0753/DUF2309 family)
MKTETPSYPGQPLLQDKEPQPAAFDEAAVLQELKHLLPAQAPLKDFVHHNTLHAFQHLKFHQALREASRKFGYKVFLSLSEYRSLYQSQRIREEVLTRIIADRKGTTRVKEWQEKVLTKTYEDETLPRIGMLRANWKRHYRIDLDSMVHPILFRILGSYLDQGISIWHFPVWHQGLLASLREMERKSYTSFFRSDRARQVLMQEDLQISDLLHLLVGDKALFEQYLFDQQFAHPGWSGLVSAIEDQPHTLLDPRNISLHDLIVFELLLEIDALDFQFNGKWSPLSAVLESRPVDLFAEVAATEQDEVVAIWQEAFEWSYYDQVLLGIRQEKVAAPATGPKSFQAMFCIDDRECSLRRYIEQQDPASETFGTPGFFSVEFFFQPQGGKFYTKLCPVPVEPKYLIKERESKKKRKQDVHFAKHSHGLVGGWIISQTLGFWSAFRLFLHVFRPSLHPATATSFGHMDKVSKLTIENKNPEHRENGLQIGFTITEMANRVEGLLKSIGLVQDFAPLVYVVGHGASSVNNPHYAAYDCGACSGRPGSVNARVFSFMANHPRVREMLLERGVVIPATTQFIGGLHDTTRDDIVFYDEQSLSPDNQVRHKTHQATFARALDLNAKERSRRFVSINTKASPSKIHERVRRRSVSLFEPRPELNHATNALCLVGRRALSKGLFLDRRSFLFSYDYRVDPEGKYLFNIMKAAAPVCGGINLEYYFSRVDNQKLGAGTKLPHNVMGLVGVANGIDGDLRPGLPSQMIEVHDPVRLFFVLEHYPDVVLRAIQELPATYEWFINEWVHLVVVNPETGAFSVFQEGQMVDYQPAYQPIRAVADITPLLESHQENFPVYTLS